MVLVIVVVIVGVVFASKNDSEDSMQKDSQVEEEMMEKESASKTEDGKVMAEKEETMMESGSYETYSLEKLALASEGDVVLFFRASWCPTCRALDADIKANMKNIPAKVAILDVDYDNSTALKQKYGVTYQHTLVQVDANGNQITKWKGSPTLASLIENIK